MTSLCNSSPYLAYFWRKKVYCYSCRKGRILLKERKSGYIKSEICRWLCPHEHQGPLANHVRTIWWLSLIFLLAVELLQSLFSSDLTDSNSRSRQRQSMQADSFKRCNIFVVVTQQKSSTVKVLKPLLLQVEKEQWLKSSLTVFLQSGNNLAAHWESVKQPISSIVTHSLSASIPYAPRSLSFFGMTLNSPLGTVAQNTLRVCPA